MKYVDYNGGGGFSIGKMKDTDIITQDDVLDRLKPQFHTIRQKGPQDIIITYRDSNNRLKSFVLKDVLQEVESKKKFQKLLEHIPPFVQQ